MMATAPVTWFEVHTPDPETSRRFYSELFGWTFSSEMPGYDLVGQGEEARIGGGVASTGSGHKPMNVFCVQVDDVVAMCERAVEAGGTVVMPAQVTPAGLAFAYVADPHGSVFGVWRPPTAL
jgi:uncharacterized protein